MRRSDNNIHPGDYRTVFTGVTSCFCHKNFIARFFIYFFIINNQNVQQWSLKVIANSSFAHIFCIFSRVRTVCVQIGRTSYGRTLFSNFGLNVRINKSETALHSNRLSKISSFSTKRTISFIENSKIFSETAWPLKAKFYVGPPWVGGTIFCSWHLGHMTKMAATPVYGKNPSKIFFSRTGRPIFTKLGM